MLASASTRVERFRQSQELRLAIERRKRLGVRIGLLFGGGSSLAILLSVARAGCEDNVACKVGIAFVLGLIVGGLGLILLRVPRLRPFVILPTAACLATSVLLFFTVFPLEPLREAAFRRLTRSAEPVAAAIRSFEERHATPPPTLDALVPEFLPELPRPTFWCPSELVYSPQPPNDDSPRDWTLRLLTANGFSLDYLPPPEAPFWLALGATRSGDWLHIDVN